MNQLIKKPKRTKISDFNLYCQLVTEVNQRKDLKKLVATVKNPL